MKILLISILLFPQLLLAQSGVLVGGNSVNGGNGAGGTVVPVAPAVGGCSINASDNFTRANENPVSQGGNWKLLPTEGWLQVLGNVLTFTNCSFNGAMYFDGGLGWTNCPSQTSSTWIQGGPSVSSATGWGPFVRGSPTVRTYYEALAWQGNVRLQERIFGTGNTVLALIPLTYVQGAELTLAVNGSDLTNNVNLIVTYNSVVLTNMHPFHVITNGFPGIRFASPDSTCGMSVTNWVGSSP